MSTYAIGDIQGCYTPLQQLLAHIQFDPAKDTLWFIGDLVNRGSQSLETLRFIKSLGQNQRSVLGNHDLHLLAVALGVQKIKSSDTFTDILAAPDRDELIHWLLHLPLVHHDTDLSFTMVHAGLAPSWDLPTAINLSKEVETILQSSSACEFLQNMYGNEPALWHPDLQGWDRLRCITNYFTRLRFCRLDGSLELTTKGTIGSHPADLFPWFQIPDRLNANLNILFGHWAALHGETNIPNVFALDTGCAWGYCLTAMRLEDRKKFSVSCS